MGAVRLGIDIGGTFTDVTVLEEDTGRVTVTKVPSRGSDPGGALIDAIGARSRARGRGRRGRRHAGPRHHDRDQRGPGEEAAPDGTADHGRVPGRARDRTPFPARHVRPDAGQARTRRSPRAALLRRRADGRGRGGAAGTGSGRRFGTLRRRSRQRFPGCGRLFPQLLRQSGERGARARLAAAGRARDSRRRLPRGLPRDPGVRAHEHGRIERGRHAAGDGIPRGHRAQDRGGAAERRHPADAVERRLPHRQRGAGLSRPHDHLRSRGRRAGGAASRRRGPAAQPARRRHGGHQHGHLAHPQGRTAHDDGRRHRRAARQGADDRDQHHRRRRGKYRLARRLERPARGSPERRGGSGARRLRARRHGADRHRRQPGPGPHAPRPLRRRRHDGRPGGCPDRDRGEGRRPARHDDGGGGGRYRPHRQRQHGTRPPGELRGEGLRSPATSHCWRSAGRGPCTPRRWRRPWAFPRS